MLISELRQNLLSSLNKKLSKSDKDDLERIIRRIRVLLSEELSIPMWALFLIQGETKCPKKIVEYIKENESVF